ncbi:MAG: hypothetical protein HY209_01945 [Candidatus Omnitrophica bacterium]|nr:hypothetical protein [Candidatus Omnitrophota bacterium]
MTTDHFLFRALLISLTIHTMVVGSGYWMKLPQLQRARLRSVEITYKPISPRALDIRQHVIKPAQKLDLQNSLLLPSNDAIGIKLVKDSQEFKDFVYERRPVRIKSLQVNHITVTPIVSQKINNPIYTSYQDRVRESIKERVYANYNQLDNGKVYLTFIIASDGSLKDYQVIDAKTRASQNLRYISTKSLKEARFPPFLKGMTLPEYTFNIEIEYQLRDQ